MKFGQKIERIMSFIFLEKTKDSNLETYENIFLILFNYTKKEQKLFNFLKTLI